MDFFGDFCLSCDAQTNGSAFCSQACRLAELDNYTNPAPSSPTYWHTDSIYRPSMGTSSVLYLPPAIDFSVYRMPLATSKDSVRSTKSKRRISEQARIDLDDYVTSFDHTRTLRRRISMQSSDDEKPSRKFIKSTKKR